MASTNRGMSNLRSTQDLWVFLSGTSIRSEDLIRVELENNADRIRQGVCSFHKPCLASADKLKGDKNIGSVQLQFLLKLSKFMDLDEIQTQTVFGTYLLCEFQGTDETLKNILMNERQSREMMLQIWDWYLKERLHLLLCLKKIVTYWNDDQHYNHQLFQYFFKDTGNGPVLIGSIIKQLELVTEAPQPTIENEGPLMKETQVRKWAVSNLKEQCELLQLLLLVFRDIDCPIPDFIKLAKLFKKWGFGKKPANIHFLDSSSNALLNAISYCQVIVLIQNLELQSLLPTDDDEEHENPKSYYLSQDLQVFEEVDKLFTGLGSQEEHGPLLVAWTVVKSLVSESGTEDFRAVRCKLNRCKPLVYLQNLLDAPIFKGDSMVAVVGHTVVYELLLALVNLFTEDSIGNVKDLYALSARVLHYSNIANDFWMTGLESGLGLLLSKAAEQFPQHITNLMKLCVALSSSGPISTQKVAQFLKVIPTLTRTADASVVYGRVFDVGNGVVYLIQPYFPYGQDGICLPAGTKGVLLPVSDGDPVVRWSFPINAWMVWKSLVQHHLDFNLSTVGLINEDLVTFLIDLAKLVTRMAVAGREFVTPLSPLIDLLLTVAQRFSMITLAPVPLVAAFISMSSALCRHFPTEIWQKVTRTGLLPYFTNNSTDVTILTSGVNLNVGVTGTILASQEKVTGQYPVTLAIVELASALASTLTPANDADYLACLTYILREIFPNFATWHFIQTGDKERLGQSCLNLFISILNVPCKPGDGLSETQYLTQRIIVHAALHREAGKALLILVSVGEEALQDLPVWSVGEEPELARLVRLSLALLVRLLHLAPKRIANENRSSLEATICGQPQCILSVAKYARYRGDVRLATLAILFLKRVAEEVSLSLLACLGTEAKFVQSLLMRRLVSDAEDPRLRSAILHLLVVCLERQAGFADMFVDLQTEPVEPSKDQEKEAKNTCLQCIAKILRHHKLRTAFCTPDLHTATVNFVHALWFWRWRLATTFLQNCSNFWENLCSPLTDCDDDGHLVPSQANAYILKVLSLEIFHKQGKVSAELKGIIQKVATSEKLMVWPEVASGSLKDDEREVAELLTALNAWKEFYTILTEYKAVELTASQRDILVHKLLEGLQTLMECPHPNAPFCVGVIGDGILQLLCTWRRSPLPFPPEWGDHLGTVFDTMSNKLDTIPLQATNSILASLLTFLRVVHPGTNPLGRTSERLSLESWVSPSCTFLLACIQSDYVDKGHRRQALLLCLGLMKELVVLCPSSQTWLHHLKHSPIVSVLFNILSSCLKDEQLVDITESVIALFIVLSEQPDMSDLVANSDIAHHLCLSISSSSENQDNKAQLRIFNAAVRLLTVLIRVQGCKFIEGAVDFTCVHQLRIIQILQNVRSNLDADYLNSVAANLSLIQQMMLFWQQWKLYHRSSLEISVAAVCRVCYITVSFLLRPTFVQHVVEGAAKSSQNNSVMQRVRRFSSNEEVEKPSPVFMETQSSLFRIMALCISTLALCSPELQELLYDRACFSHQWNPLLEMTFSTPSLDQVGPICFGTLISCINACVRALTKQGERAVSPARALATDTTLQCNRPLLMFILEKTTTVVIGQSALYLLNPNIDSRGKQFIQREIGAELGSSLQSLLRSVRRSSSAVSPMSGLVSPSNTQTRGSTDRLSYIHFMNTLVGKMFKYM